MKGKNEKTLLASLPEYIEVPWAIFSFIRRGAFGEVKDLPTLLLITALCEDGQGCDWTDEEIAEELGLTASEVAKRIARLERIGAIESTTSPDGTRLLVSRYAYGRGKPQQKET